jgi:hypothetical protein
MLFGTRLVVSWHEVLRAGATPVQEAKLLKLDPGLDRLPAAPTFAGYGYLPGSSSHAAVVARLTDRRTGTVALLAGQDALPLFWSPPPKH